MQGQGKAGACNPLADVRLPASAQKLLDLVYPTLHTFLGAKRLFLGGGTALAARWKHRLSTDIDLFLLEDDPESLYSERQGLLRDVVRTLPGFVCASFDRDYAELQFDEPLGSVSWMRSVSLTANPISRQVAHGTRIRLESVSEILAKKLVHRMARRGDFPARDVYDLAWAAMHCRGALTDAVNALTGPERELLAYNLASLPVSWYSSQSGRPLVEPADANLAARSASVAVEGLRSRGIWVFR